MQNSSRLVTSSWSSRMEGLASVSLSSQTRSTTSCICKWQALEVWRRITTRRYFWSIHHSPIRTSKCRTCSDRNLKEPRKKNKKLKYNMPPIMQQQYLIQMRKMSMKTSDRTNSCSKMMIRQAQDRLSLMSRESANSQMSSKHPRWRSLRPSDAVRREPRLDSASMNSTTR